MKIPFGKFKDKDFEYVSEVNPNYLTWLYSVAKGKLKVKLEVYIESKEFKQKKNDYISSRIRQNIEDEYNYQKSQRIKYEDDYDFWIRVSPYSVYDDIKKFDTKIDDETWKKLCNRILKIEGG